MEYDFTKIPLNRIQRFGHITMVEKKVFTVSWLLGRYCNYKCSYCWTHGRSDDKDHRPTELLLRTLDEIKRQARDNGFNSFNFSFSGGEPTLHPGYLELLRKYADDDHANFQGVHMTSNLSPGIPWFEKYVEATKPLQRQYVTGSWHREFADKEKFIEKCQFLVENDIQVTINMVMVPKWFWELYDEALWFLDHGVNVTLKPQSDPSANFVVTGYTEEMLAVLQKRLPQQYVAKGIRIDSNYNAGKQNSFEIQMIDDQGQTWWMDEAERFNSFNFNNFYGWHCHAGYQSIIIREPCGSIKRSYSCVDKSLGNIEKGFELFKTPKKCISMSCVSSADSKIPKYKE